MSEPRPARPEDVHEVVRLSAAVFRPSGADLAALRERVAGRFAGGRLGTLAPLIPNGALL